MHPFVWLALQQVYKAVLAQLKKRALGTVFRAAETAVAALRLHWWLWWGN